MRKTLQLNHPEFTRNGSHYLSRPSNSVKSLLEVKMIKVFEFCFLCLWKTSTKCTLREKITSRRSYRAAIRDSARRHPRKELTSGWRCGLSPWSGRAQQEQLRHGIGPGKLRWRHGGTRGKGRKRQYDLEGWRDNEAKECSPSPSQKTQRNLEVNEKRGVK